MKGRTRIAMALCLAAAACLSLSLAATAAASSVVVPFGSLLNGCAGFGNARAAVALAVEDINNSTMLGVDATLALPPMLSLVSKDFCTLNGFVHASGLPYKATEFLTPATHPLMVVGPVSSSEAVSSILQQGHITSIAPTNVVSLNKALFPYQATSDCLIVKQGDILADLASQLGWKEVSVLFNGVYQDLTNTFTARATLNSVRVVTSVSFSVADTTAGHNITLTTQMAALKASGARIFVLFIYQADIRAVFTAMADAGLTGAPYACMGSNEWLRFLYSASPGAQVLPFLQGCIGTAIGTAPQGPEFLNFSARWREKYDRSPASMFSTPAPLVTSLLFYNAAMAVGYAYKALYALLNRCGGWVDYNYAIASDTYTFKSVNTTAWSTSPQCLPYAAMDAGAMLNALLVNPAEVSFTSLLGPVSLLPDGSRAPTYQLVNIPLNDGQLQTFGSSGVNGTSTSLSYSLRGVYWPGGGNMGALGAGASYDGALTVPLYRALDLYPGLVLEKRTNASTAILAYLFGVLGCFVGFLLFEDPLLHAKMRKQTPHDLIGIATAAMAFAIAAVWPTFFIAQAQLSVQATSLRFEAIRVSLSWVALWMLFCAVLWIKTLSFRSAGAAVSSMRSRQSKQGDEENGYDQSVTAVGTEAPAEATNSNAQQANAQEATGFAAVKGQFKGIGAALIRIDSYSLASALLFACALGLMQVLGLSALIAPAMLSLDVATMVIGTVVVLVLCLFSIQLLCHLDRIQWTSSFFLALPIFLSHQFPIMAMKFTYDLDKAAAYASGQGTDLGLLQLVSVLIAASCCFILVAAQFYRNKLTSQGWLRQLVSLLRDKRKLTSQLATTKTDLRTAQSLADSQQVSMQLIHLARPRNMKHLAAFAWTLSQGTGANKTASHNRRRSTDALRAELNITSSMHSALDPGEKDSARGAQVMPLHVPSSMSPTSHSRGFGSMSMRDLSLSSPSSETFHRTLQWLQDVTSDNALKTELVDAPELDAVMMHPFGAEMFRACLRDTMAEESFLFCSYAELYAAEPCALIRRSLATDLCSLFIAVGSVDEINVSGDVRQGILAKVAEGNFAPTLFQAASNEAMRLMHTNAWAKFKASPVYRLVTAVITKQNGEWEKETR